MEVMLVHILRGIIALGFFAAASYTFIRIAQILANRNRGGSPDEMAAIKERIAQLEHAVEGLTVDSGRLIDGQRFLSQLLTERSGAAQPVGRAARRSSATSEGLTRSNAGR